MKRRLPLALLLPAIATLLAFTVPRADVTGTWIVSGVSPSGPVRSTVRLAQVDSTLRGDIEIAQVGWSTLRGIVRGDSIQYTFPLTMRGAPIDVVVRGVLATPDSMSGTITLPDDLGSYPYTATRQPSK